METLGYVLIVVLLATEMYCGYSLRKILRSRSEQRTDERRAYYRRKAYKTIRERRKLKKARETLFNSITKGDS